ncbi:unnamed protein product [Laminaria digitata]
MALRFLLTAAAFFSLRSCREVCSFVGVPVVRRRVCSQQQSSLVNHERCWRSGLRRPRDSRRRDTATMMARGSAFRSTGESKRQARVSQLVTGELAKILRQGHGIKTKDKIDDDVRCKIAVVDVDMSPDLRTAKVFISVYGDVLEKREAYAWCVKNTKSIRMALATELKGMKRVPELFFRDTDIGAAVDLMALIDRVSDSDEASAAAARESSGDDEIEGFEGLTEEDFFTFDFDEDGDEDDDDEDDVGFDLEEEEGDGDLQ